MSESQDTTIALNVRWKWSGFSAHPLPDDTFAAEGSVGVDRLMPGEAWEANRRSLRGRIREVRERMHRRAHDLSMMAQRQQQLVIIFLMVLAGILLCLGLTAEAKSDYDIINTGIKGGGCWVDENRFLVQKNVPRQGSQGYDLEGLYVLDPVHPTELKPISLAPLESSAQKRVWQVTCQDGNITFLVPGSKRGSSRLYRLTIGEAPELIVEMRAPRVSLQGKYVLGNSHRAVMDGGPLQCVFEGNDDCLLADAKAGFKVLCWDWWLVVPEALPQYVFSKYLWQESIKVKDPNGQAKWVPNPEPPLKRPDGTAVKLGFFLKDLDNRIVGEIPNQQNEYYYDTIHLKLSQWDNISTAPVGRSGITVKNTTLLEDGFADFA